MLAWKSLVSAGALALALVLPASAADNAINGRWMDAEGTMFPFRLCGDGTTLCGTLNDIQGASRTEKNMAYVNQQVVTAEQAAPNKWKGTVNYGGSRAAATVTQTGPDTIEIQGCQLLILCETLVFNRV